MIVVGISVYLLSATFAVAAPLSTVENLSLKPLPCSEQGDCIDQSLLGCKEICGCDGIFIFNETLDNCQLNRDLLKRKTVQKYDAQDKNNLTEGDLATKIRANAERIFAGIMVSVIIFITCVSVGITLGCLYCCQMSYSDRQIHKDIKALSKKLKTNGKLKKPAKQPRAAVAESCNVIVDDAGLFVC